MTKPVAVRRRSAAFFPVLCAAILIGILLAGLWPRHVFSTNEASWLKTRNGLNFQRFGIAYTPEPVSGWMAGSGEGHPVSIEIVVNAGRESSYRLRRILSLYDDREGERCFIGQWKSGLILRGRTPEPSREKTPGEIGANGVLTQGRERFVAVVSGDDGTAIYVDGELRKFSRDFVLLGGGRPWHPCLAVGNSPDGKNPWEGDIFGLAIYDRRLAPEEIVSDYEAWRKDGSFPGVDGQGRLLRYRFDERGGTVARNSGGPRNDLSIPRSFRVPHRVVLGHNWRDQRIDRSFIADVVVNIAGFVPFGFFFFAWLSGRGGGIKARDAVIVVLLGSGISLIIEICQAFLPARTSSTMDVISNTAGTVAGVVLFRVLSGRVRFPGRGAQ
jgi:hypothetical protein